MAQKTDWLKLAKEADEAASAFVDSNYRADWDYSIRAFRNEHANGSKYLSAEFQHRSRLFRPKTRAVIRKNEAAAAAALFSNMEIVDLQPMDPDNPMAIESRDAMKAILEYRLQNTLPWFELCMGGVQDAQTQGAVCSYQYWDYQNKNGKVVKDNPCIDLRPIENIRLDGGASWVDPVGTSPYFYDIIPMPVCQVRGMMESTDPKTGAPKWKKFDDSVILRATPDMIDSTRKARMGKQQDPHEEKKGLREYDTVWVYRWFMRDRLDDDFTFYTLGTEALLTAVKPLEEVYFHGIRPYAMGYAVLETHKVFKTPVPMLVKPIQQEMNDLANQRIDNVKFVLNKRWIVARGRQTDVNSLVRNVPGGVTLTTDPKLDVQESNWPDVTSSSYVEQDRLNADFDDLAGNFSPATKFANKGTSDTLGGNRLAAQGAGLMTDYLLRTIIETWTEKVLRQLVKLEAAYETDDKVLAICAKKARLFPRYGKIPEDMLNDEVTLTVNVGMGASNPNERFQKLILGTNAIFDTVAKAPQNYNVKEFIKEASSNMGYRDGSRFWMDQVDPRLAKAMQLVQQMQGMLDNKKLEIASSEKVEAAKLQSNEKATAAQLQVDMQRIQGDLRIREAELVVEQQRLEIEKLKIQMESSGATDEYRLKVAEVSAKVEEARLKLEHERLKIEAEAAKIRAEADKNNAEIEKTKMETASKAHEMQIREREANLAEQQSKEKAESDARTESVTKKVSEDMDAVKGELKTLATGLGAVAQVVNMPSRKAKGFKLKKNGGKKTQAVVVKYNDGSEEELPVEAA